MRRSLSTFKDLNLKFIFVSYIILLDSPWTSFHILIFNFFHRDLLWFIQGLCFSIIFINDLQNSPEIILICLQFFIHGFLDLQLIPIGIFSNHFVIISHVYNLYIDFQIFKNYSLFSNIEKYYYWFLGYFNN